MFVREAVLSDFVGVPRPFISTRGGTRIYSVSRTRSLLQYQHVLALRVPVVLVLEAWQMPIAAHTIF